MSRKKKRQVSKGTGKRFTSSKTKPQAVPIRRTPSPPSYAEQMLRKRIGQFGLGKRFSDDFEKAFELYMEDQAPKSGKRPPMRVDIIREELGL